MNEKSVKNAATECGMEVETWLNHYIKILQERCPNSTLIPKLQLMLL